MKQKELLNWVIGMLLSIDYILLVINSTLTD
jgi:hypothetical protein